MAFVQRRAGIIVGVFARQQPGLADEELPDDHAEIVAYFSMQADALKNVIPTYGFLQRWTAAERNLLRRRVLQADAIGDGLGDAIDLVKVRGSINVASAPVTTFMNICVAQAILTAPRSAQILDLTQASP